VTYRLVLLRHAKTEQAGATDAVRQLTPKGRRQASNLAKSFADAGVVPELVLVSSAIRAQQTWSCATAVKKKLNKCPKQILDALYGASVADVLGVLRVVSPALQTVVVVGHEPTMSACAAYLADKTSDETALAQVKVGVPTAAWSLLQSDYPWIEWGAKSARLVTVRRPND